MMLWWSRYGWLSIQGGVISKKSKLFSLFFITCRRASENVDRYPKIDRQFFSITILEPAPRGMLKLKGNSAWRFFGIELNIKLKYVISLRPNIQKQYFENVSYLRLKVLCRWLRGHWNVELCNYLYVIESIEREKIQVSLEENEEKE